MAEIFWKRAGLAQAAPRLGWRSPALAVAATGLVALCAHISIPLGFTPVPITMQTFAVLLIGLLFSPGLAFATLALYLVEGAAGLPVFSPQYAPGMAQILGPTGGYLLAYPFAAALVSRLSRQARHGLAFSTLAAALGGILILASGALWISLLTRESFASVLALSVAPFLPGDAIKAAAAALAACAWNRLRRGN